MTVEQFIQSHIDEIDAGAFQIFFEKAYLALDKHELDNLIYLLSEVFPEDVKTALENVIDKILNRAFTVSKVELPLNISDFLESYDYNLFGYDSRSLADYLRKNGLKYGVKIVDNPVYGEPFITYIIKV